MNDRYGNGKLGLYDPSLHLFVDDDEVRATQHVSRIWGQLRKLDAPLLEPEFPHEGVRVQADGMMFDDAVGKFRCWYMTLTPRDEGHPEHLYCYAESDD